MIWGKIILSILLLITVVGFCSAAIPDNLSSFDPKTFTLSEINAPDAIETVRAEIDVSDDSGMISGIGSVSDEIRVTDEYGDVTVSTLEIIGTDETVWRYQFQNQTTGNIATAVTVEVENAERLNVRSVACRNDGDIAQSLAMGRGYSETKKITGNMYLQSGFSTDIDTGDRYPVSLSLVDSLTGAQIRIIDTAEPDGQISFGSLDGDTMASSLPVQIGDEISDDLPDLISSSPEDITPEESTDILSYFIRNTTSGRVQSSGVTDNPMTVSWMDLNRGVLDVRFGNAYKLPTEAFSFQYVTGMEAAAGSLFTITQNEKNSDISEHQIEGEEISDMWYYGTGRYSGEESQLAVRYDFSSGTQGLRRIYYQDEDNRYLSDNQETGSSPVNPEQGSSLYSGEDILTTRDQTLSFSGNYDITSPHINRNAFNVNGNVRTDGNLVIGDETGKKPVSLKGYVQHQISPGQNPASSMQSLFYADASRGTPMNWDSMASQGDEPVTTTGSSTGGSRFIRQKTYADRSYVIAS